MKVFPDFNRNRMTKQLFVLFAVYAWFSGLFVGLLVALIVLHHA